MSGQAPQTIRVKYIEEWQIGGYIDLLKGSLTHRQIQIIDSPSARLSDWNILHLHAPQYWFGCKLFSRLGIIGLWRIFISFLKLKIIRFLGKKIVWTAHDIVEQFPHSPLWAKMINGVLARNAAAIIVHGETPRKLLMEYWDVPAHRIHVVPHPAFQQLYPNRQSKQEARLLLGIPENSRTYLLLGNVREQKGAPDFLDAMRKIPDENIVFVVAGNPENGRLARQLEKESLRNKRLKVYWGTVPPELLQVYFNASDIAVFPYKRITTSGALMLAMSFGKPVIGTDINCLGEVIHPQGGWKYDPADPEGLEKCLRESLVSSESELREMGAYNQRLTKPWTWDRLADECQSIYRDLLKIGK
jgi:glycosyltransferase involved in cell wall biosynthesis